MDTDNGGRWSHTEEAMMGDKGPGSKSKDKKKKAPKKAA